MPNRNYWIGVAAKAQVERAVAEGYAELCRGRATPLERMRAGDGLLIYSPRTEYPRGPALQAFTALGRIRDGTVYQAAASVDGEARPFRLAVDYLPAMPQEIRPLIGTLSFLRSKTHWGAAFRFGIVRVPEYDFRSIAIAMGRDFAADFPAPEVAMAEATA